MLNRSQAPAFNQEFSFELAQPEITPLSDHLNLIFIPGLHQEIFKLEVVFSAGKWFEPRIGLAHFTALMLDKGTKNKSAQKIAKLLDYFGAQVEISEGYDFTSASLYGLKKYFEETVNIFLEIITEPIFPEAELEIQQEIFIQSLRVNNEKNSFIASKLLRKNIFGNTHPYGSSIEEQDVEVLSAEDLRQYFRFAFAPHELFLIGNLDVQTIKWLSAKLNFESKHNFIRETPVIHPGSPLQQIQKSESLQSSIRLGQRIVNRNHEDYFSLLFLNHILGGYFGSRLMKNIREKKGLTYGIYSSITPFKNDAMFSVGADVDKQKLELARKEIRNEILLLTEETISDTEVALAKNHFLGSLQLEIANPFASLEKIKNIRLNKLEADYYSRLITSLQKETPDHLKAIAEKYFSAPTFFEVLVG